MFSIRDVIVDKISLISRGNRPAVPKAETKFSIFKMAQKPYLEDLDRIIKAYDKKTLYVSRKVKNGDEIIEWAKSQGIKDLIGADELHVTVAFSKEKVIWDNFTPNTEEIEISVDSDIRKLGDAIVLPFESEAMQKDWKKYTDGGASWDYESYTPHISLSYNGDQDISKVGAFSGSLTLKKEVMEEIKKEYLEKLEAIINRY